MDTNQFSVIIQAVLEKSGITRELSEIQKIVDKNMIKIVPQLETASLKNNLKQISNEIAKTLNQSIGGDFKITGNDVFKALNQELKQISTTATKTVSELSRLTKVESMQKWADNNSKAMKKYGDDINRIIQRFAQLDVAMDSVESDKLVKEFKQIQNQARQTGNLGLTTIDKLTNAWEKFGGWSLATGALMKSIQSIKDMIINVKELDDSLLELSKVSDLSADGLVKVTEEAYELGETVGKTGRQVIDAVTEFKRAGFELNDSMNMAKAALVMTNVAEGINDTADAAGTLISVLKGYNMAESETMSIVDKINQASNLNPIGFDQIAEGLERTAGTMAQSGTTIDQTIGLLTAGYAQLRNVEKVSTGLITLSARLRGVGEDGETIDGLSAKLQEDFGKIGVAIEDADGNLRSIYEIAQDYAKVLPTLSSKQKQYYAELAAGKRQVTVWNAITQQFSDAEKATADSINSLNSASEENQKYLDSISGKVSQFNSAVEQLSSTIVDSDLIKFFVDLGTTGVKAIDGLINALTPLGAIGAIGGGIGIGQFVKNFA